MKLRGAKPFRHRVRTPANKFAPKHDSCFGDGLIKRQPDDRCIVMPRADPIDLDTLDDYLMSDHAPDDSMGLSDLDGFLAGIVVGPELILPSEWLPVIWGGDEPVFQTEDEMRAVLGAIIGRYDEIAACFNADPDGFDPIFLEGPEGEVIASDWAGGFLDAVALRPMAWKPLIENDGVGILMAPIFLLNGDMEIDDAADENELMAEASDMIPTCIWRSVQWRGSR
jgi:uncharacterized protein